MGDTGDSGLRGAVDAVQQSVRTRRTRKLDGQSAVFDAAAERNLAREYGFGIGNCDRFADCNFRAAGIGDGQSVAGFGGGDDGVGVIGGRAVAPVVEIAGQSAADLGGDEYGIRQVIAKLRLADGDAHFRVVKNLQRGLRVVAGALIESLNFDGLYAFVHIIVDDGQRVF